VIFGRATKSPGPNGTVVIEWVRGLAVDASGDF